MNSVYRIITGEKRRLIIRNHWGNNFNDSFILTVSKTYQGNGLMVYRLGLFNFCLCLMIER
jgi:hypothetical protein